ncbi:MAG: hypothetical protein JXA09_00145 [Anaerolineae bacterium]|nr:hypothetical protein [Anaerolineae bacterium]
MIAALERRVRARWRLDWRKLGERLWRGLRVLALLAVLLATLQTGDPPPAKSYHHRLADRTGMLSFNFVRWEVGALLRKVGDGLAAPQDTLRADQRHALVISYMGALRRARALEGQIVEVYSAGDEPGATAATRAESLERERAELRAWMAARQDMVEGILEAEVSSALQAEGFGWSGFVWPPVKIRFTPLPLLLVTSDRAAITRAGDVHLKAGLPIAERERLEGLVDGTFADKRALVTPIGGLSAYPAMILETDALVWLADTFAHEWTHHYLAFHPLGVSYSRSTEMTSINETTASIVGREIGRRVILSAYPELADQLPALPMPPETPPMSGGEIVWPDTLPADQFDFSREMRETRLTVDDLLAVGQVAEAEAYMEERRRLFVENGYNIRKLNQAYFAFYGSYATGPSTANPIGGQLEWLRAQSDTLRGFVRVVSALDEHQDLLDLLPPA